MERGSAGADRRTRCGIRTQARRRQNGRRDAGRPTLQRWPIGKFRKAGNRRPRFGRSDPRRPGRHNEARHARNLRAEQIPQAPYASAYRHSTPIHLTGPRGRQWSSCCPGHKFPCRTNHIVPAATFQSNNWSWPRLSKKSGRSKISIQKIEIWDEVGSSLLLARTKGAIVAKFLVSPTFSTASATFPRAGAS